MEFEWDEAKREANLAKHGIDFEDARWVMQGRIAIMRARSTGHETRLRAVGFLNGRFVTVIYTMRGDVVRVISVRRARRDERREYQAIYG